jgi:hypothetical protein
VSNDEVTRRVKHEPISHVLKEVPGMEGIAYCETCLAGEGELLSYCPGHRLNEHTLEACYRGNVVDFVYWKQLHEEPCDYVPASAFPDEL